MQKKTQRSAKCAVVQRLCSQKQQTPGHTLQSPSAWQLKLCSQASNLHMPVSRWHKASAESALLSGGKWPTQESACMRIRDAAAKEHQSAFKRVCCSNQYYGFGESPRVRHQGCATSMHAHVLHAVKGEAPSPRSSSHIRPQCAYAHTLAKGTTQRPGASMPHVCITHSFSSGGA